MFQQFLDRGGVVSVVFECQTKNCRGTAFAKTANFFCGRLIYKTVFIGSIPNIFPASRRICGWQLEWRRFRMGIETYQKRVVFDDLSIPIDQETAQQNHQASIIGSPLRVRHALAHRIQPGHIMDIGVPQWPATEKLKPAKDRMLLPKRY